jgi:hypothetical protein
VQVCQVKDTFHMCSAQTSFPVRAHSSQLSTLHLADAGISAVGTESKKEGEVRPILFKAD